MVTNYTDYSHTFSLAKVYFKCKIEINEKYDILLY